jgi:hypothetical protein
MNFDLDEFVLDWESRNRDGQQTELKQVSDEKLMQLHAHMLTLPSGSGHSRLYAAIYNEVRDRELAAGWFWRRWRNPGRYQKWVQHRLLIEAKAQQKIQDILSRHEGSN